MLSPRYRYCIVPHNDNDINSHVLLMLKIFQLVLQHVQYLFPPVTTRGSAPLSSHAVIDHYIIPCVTFEDHPPYQIT